MATDFDYCPQNLFEHELIQCSNWLHGGIDGIIIFKTDAYIADYTVLANWTALINSGDATRIKNVKGELPSPSVTESENPIGCGTDNVVDGADYDLSIKDYNVNAENDESYASVNGGTFYIAVHLCNEDQLLIIESNVTAVTPQANVPTSKKEKQFYDTHYKWSADKDFSYIRIDSPAGLF